VIAEHGIEALSLRGLARDLGVSHSAPTSHFSDRKALLAAVAREGFERSLAAMRAGADAAGPDPVARYRALGRSYVRFAVEETAYFRAINQPEVRALADQSLRDGEAAFVTVLREGVEAAQESGWHPDADPNALLAFSISAAMGAAALFGDESWRRMLGLDDLGATDALADAVLDLVVHRSRTQALPDPASPDAALEVERKVS
jgi:AcrR family transcriptional regulator